MSAKLVNTCNTVAGWIGHMLSSTAEADYTLEKLTSMLREAGALLPEEEVTGLEMSAFGGRGFVGTMHKLNLTYNTDRAGLEKVLVLKTSGDAKGKAFSIGIGGYREGSFYNTFAKTTCKDYALPSFHAYSNSLTGKYSILMRDMSKDHVGVNLLLGNQIWGLPEGFDRSAHPDEGQVLKTIFLTAGKFHAEHWGDKTLFDCKFLKGVDVLQGKGKMWWDMSVAMVQGAWKNRRKSVQYSDRVLKVMEESLAASTFENMVQTLQKGPLTLCHGDWHAANMFYKDGSILLCDWCDVGVWNPLRDLGQFVVSDVKIPQHAKEFPDLIKLYYNTLKDCGADLGDYTFEECWDDFVVYGVNRWVYFIPIMDVFPSVPDSLMTYFGKQLDDFLEAFAPKDVNCYPILPVVGLY
eukprot:TRINITY_DN30214_c0_g1_i1.p1 TRINITY_DN30214_c0_g1~~TRINITY_DN30214_c0_g1_i1.p1  ORF type:complete len:408 (+),score=132.41 TRINITY_DN30214_c0_g1_i1:76-1299(+)